MGISNVIMMFSSESEIGISLTQVLVMALIFALLGTITYSIARAKNLDNWGWHLILVILLFPLWWIIILVFFKKKIECQNCQKKINADSKVCNYCGTKVL